MGNVFIVSRKREREILPECPSKLLSLLDEELDGVNEEANSEVEQEGMLKMGRG